MSSTAEAPSDPAPASAQSLEGVLGGLEGSAETTPQDAPQDQDVAAAGVTAGSDKPPSDVAPKTQSQTTSQQGPDTSGNTANDADDSAKSGTEVETGGTQSPTGTTVDVSQFEGNFTQSTSRSSGAGTSVQITSPSFSDSRFTGSTSSGNFDLSLPATPGTFTVSSTSPFDTVSGTGFLSDNKDFVFYELTEATDSTKRELAFAGTPVTSVPSSGATFYAVQNDFLLGSNVPFVRSTAGGDITLAEAESKGDTAIVWGTGSSAATAISGTAQRVWGHRTIVINGQGSSQQSVLMIMGGEIKLDSQNSNAPYMTGGALATSRLDTSKQAYRIESEVTTLDASATNTGKAQFFGSGNPDYFALISANRTSSTSATTDNAEEEFGATTSTYKGQTVVLKVDDESLNSRTSKTRYGYTGGALQEITASGVLSSTTLFRNETSDPKDVVVKTSAETNKVNADIDVTDAFGSAFSSLKVDFGDKDTAFGDGTSTTGESVFIDDKRFAASDRDGTNTTFSGGTVLSDDLALVTASSDSDFAVNFLPSGVTLCACDFLTWGFWSGDIDLSSGVHEIIHLANWVAGEIPTLSAVSALSGSAAYSGHAIGTVKDGSSVFQAVGNWDYTFNFDSPASSTGTISSFDSGSYTIGGATLSSGDSSRNKFSGNLTGASGTASGRSGSFVGSIMQNGSTVNAGMGGHFQVSGTNYQASGIFAAAK